jgi:hypothetical protein
VGLFTGQKPFFPAEELVFKQATVMTDSKEGKWEKRDEPGEM